MPLPTRHRANRRDQPAYLLPEAARYARVAPATLRAWVAGRNYIKQTGPAFSPPLIRPADATKRILSFNNLIEAHVLQALRTTHGVPIREVRTALEYAQQQLRIDRLLLSKQLMTSAGELFLDRYGQLISLNPAGQLAMKMMLDAHLQRVEWDDGVPIKLYPFVTAVADGVRPIAIDPEVSFGRPTLAESRISTESIVQRIDSGESVQAIAEDYDITAREVEEAVLYEMAA